MGGGVSRIRNRGRTNGNNNQVNVVDDNSTASVSSIGNTAVTSNRSNRSNVNNLTIDVPTSTHSNSNIPITPGVGRHSFRRIVSEDNSLSLALATPRIGQNDINDLYTSIPYTPCANNDTNYSYYCPLCMEYFLKILTSKCCGNYTCLSCSITYLGTKDITINTADELLKLGKNKFKDISCPHCNRDEYQIELVLPQDSIRDYRINIPNTITTNDSSISPLRIGDSFEDMKRKMKPFDISRSASINDENNKNTNITNDTSDKNKIDENNIDENNIDYILSKCHSITYVDDCDIDTDNDISSKSDSYRQKYISNVSNHLTCSIIRTVSTRYVTE